MDDNMSTRMITSGQREEGVNMIAAAARKAGAEAIEELSTNGVLNSRNFQRGVLAQGDKIVAVVKAVMKATLSELAENMVGRLKRLFADKMIELRETDGKETFAFSGDVFKSGICGAVKRGVCKVTTKTIIAVYKMTKDGTYAKIFGGFGENLKRLCWTESQIVALCCDHQDLLLKEGYGTFFLFEGENSGFFVANVLVHDSGRLYVDVHPLKFDYVWNARFQHRIVVPQL